jgi:hypothetical protein
MQTPRLLYAHSQRILEISEVEMESFGQSLRDRDVILFERGSVSFGGLEIKPGFFTRVLKRLLGIKYEVEYRYTFLWNPQPIMLMHEIDMKKATMRGLVAHADSENRDLTEDEMNAFGALKAEVGEMEKGLA